MKPFLLAALAALSLAPCALAQWGDCSMEPVGPTAPIQYRWIKYAPGEFALLADSRQIGAYRAKDHAYFALLPSGQWQYTECPAALPEGVCRCPGGCKCPPDDCHCDPTNCPCKTEVKAAVPPDGVNREKVEASKGKHYHNGREVSRDALLDAIKKAAIPADQSRLRLTLIGPDADTKAILSDLKGLPEAADLVIAAYPPDAWQVSRNGLAAGRTFSIVLQAPDGRVLHRQWDYEGGVKSLSGAIQTAKGDYDAARDPDRRSRGALTEISQKFKAVPPEGWLLLAALAYLYFRKKA